MYNKIKIVHALEIEILFEKIGSLESLRNGQLHCNECDAVLNINNFGALFKKDGVIFYLCTKPNCLTTYEYIQNNEA